MGSQTSRIHKESPFACLLKHWKDLDPESLHESNSSFTAPRPGHCVLWEMKKDGHKKGALIIIPFFNERCSVKTRESGLKSRIFNFSFL
jgi:hypothetical protein